jgi:hypothetical protein
MPGNVAGFAALEAKNAAFERFKTGISFSPTNNPEVFKATYGKGYILTGKNISQLLAFAGIRREPMADHGISFTRRENKTGFSYFILNRGEKAFEGWMPLSVKASSAAIFNPMTGRSGMANGRKARDGSYEIYLKLFPGESLVVSAYNGTVKGSAYPLYTILAGAAEIKGKWNIEFIEGGPVLPPRIETEKLMSWTEFGEQSYKDFSGTARYTTEFSRPAGKAVAWQLNLGRVHESARVFINGREAGILIGPDYSIILDRKQLKKKNTLEIRVSNLMANRIAYMDRNKIEWKKFYNVNMAARLRQNNKDGIFDASSWAPLESGLIGPVTVTPLKTVK